MGLVRYIASVLVGLCSPILLAISASVLAFEDIAFAIFGSRKCVPDVAADNSAATVVIPNWNGKDLLASFLGSVVLALEGNPRNEIIVVDNASADGSAEWVKQHFPSVRVLALPENLGFGGGCNAGVREASNDIVVMLNNDMRVEPGFLAPLLRPFTDPAVFAVACQIFFSDPTKRREETGLTESWWERRGFRVSHRIDEEITDAFPCAYAGGGSSAYDKRKFLQVGGFDALYHPFYYEDTDLGHVAWKHGWKVLYQPASVVYHEHRGTIGKKFSRRYIDTVIKKNLILFCWKNIHDWRMLAGHFADAAGKAVVAGIAGVSRSDFAWAPLRAFVALPKAVVARWRALRGSVISDSELFLRQRGGYFHDRFRTTAPAAERPSVLFLSPYSIEPPVHGGAVFMKEALKALSRHCDMHVLGFVDDAKEFREQEPLNEICSSARFLIRQHRAFPNLGDLTPTVVKEFASRDFAWEMHKLIYLKRIDVLQVEYTMMAQYQTGFTRIPVFLFEHDISFQSLGRFMQQHRRAASVIPYMQLLRFELNAVSTANRVQVCSRENRDYLLQFVPQMKGRVDDDLRAVVDTSEYECNLNDREPHTLLFVGSLRHGPNLDALTWFVDHVFDLIVAAQPQVRLIIAGSGSAPAIESKLKHPNIERHGFVPDIGPYFGRYAVLLCPILSGSGVRVKMIEAFAFGIPVVSTALGAEGLANKDQEYCRIADRPEDFANATLALLQNPEEATRMAARARFMVERERDSRRAAVRLTELYKQEANRLRGISSYEVDASPSAVAVSRSR